MVHNASLPLPGGGDISLALVQAPAEWFWAQCSVAGPAPAAIAAGAFVLILVSTCCLVSCICRRCFCKRRRRVPFQMAAFDQNTMTAPMINSAQPASNVWPPQRR